MAAETPLPLTLEEHRELGKEIRRAGARFRELKRLVTTVYGANSQVAFDFARATDALDRLQLDMEAQANHDLPGLRLDGIGCATKM